jgi:hypothetical protein
MSLKTLPLHRRGCNGGVASNDMDLEFHSILPHQAADRNGGEP